MASNIEKPTPKEFKVFGGFYARATNLIESYWDLPGRISEIYPNLSRKDQNLLLDLIYLTDELVYQLYLPGLKPQYPTFDKLFESDKAIFIRKMIMKLLTENP